MDFGEMGPPGLLGEPPGDLRGDGLREIHGPSGNESVQRVHGFPYPAACGKSCHRTSLALWVAIFRMMMVMTMMVMVMMMTIAMETTATTMRRGRRVTMRMILLSMMAMTCHILCSR